MLTEALYANKALNFKMLLRLKWTFVSALLKAFWIVHITALVRTGHVDKYCEQIKIAGIFYPEVVFVKSVLNCVCFLQHAYTPRPSALPFPLSLVQYAHGPRSPPSHLPMSLAAKSPSRDLLKWNIWFHFEVPEHLNHLARKDAARVVKLLCLAAGSPSVDREHKG